jgi:NAD-dependent SIR2 family protein deacetylase/tetratricopeptide (TPR) repeat protein
MAGWPDPEIEMGVLAALLTDSEDAASYSWLLGAGASRSSGIPLAWEIARAAKLGYYESVTGTVGADEASVEAWLTRRGELQDPEHLYSDALEALLPQPRQRRKWLERYMIDARPSSGYLGLIDLARRGLVRSVLTTNFDDLLKQAAGVGEPRLVMREVTHEQAISESEWPPQKLTLLKLHGDFLFDSMRNTSEELTTLPEKQKETVVRCARDGGIVIVGYSGGDDSVMSTLEGLDDVPLGLYWLHRPGDSPNARVRSLLSRPWAYSVEIEGFDEFLATVAVRATRAGRAPALTPASLPTIPTGRFVSVDRIPALLDRVDRFLKGSTDRVCAVTGLPGIGKTELVRHAGEARSANYSATISMTAQRHELDVADLLDAARGPLNMSAAVDPSAARGEFIAALSAEPVLLILDNLESITPGLAALLRDVPAPSRALITVRDPTGLREAGVKFLEVPHEGLSESEMSDLLDLYADASPRVRAHLDELGEEHVHQLLRALKGWPQALILVIGQLESPLADASSVDNLMHEGDVVTRLLADGHAALDANAQKALLASAAFSATVTPEGLQRASAMSKASTTEALTTLLERRWLAELGSRTYAYAHPLIEEFVRSLRDRKGAAQSTRAREHLTRWLQRYGGQPDPGWANFRELDREFENVRGVLEDALDEGSLKRMTEMMAPSFPYAVERGYWSWVDDLARRLLARDPSASVRAEWLVWRSWLALYLRRDPAESARLAEEALACGTKLRRPRFEAHRRALTALPLIGEYDRAREHGRKAAKIRPKLGRRDSDEGIDLSNALAALDVAEGETQGAREMVERGRDGYRDARRRSAESKRPNTREMGVALLGEARALRALGEADAALQATQSAVAEADAIGWLRGQEVGNTLLAELADELGRPDMARAARAFAEETGAALRRPA